MKRPFMGVGIALAAGVAAGWFKVNGWLIFMLVVISAGIGVIGYIKTYWTDRTCKYLIGLSVFFVVGFCRGAMCLMGSMMDFDEEQSHILFEEQTFEVMGTVKRIQKKNKVDYLFVEDQTGMMILAVIEKEVFQSKPCYKGQVYKIRGEAEGFEHASNPGQFDEADYYCSLGVSYRIWADDVSLVSEGDWMHRFLRCLEDLKTSMMAFYNDHMSEAGSGILQAAVLGERSALDVEMKRYYQENGWMHLITTSGLHLSFVAMNSYRRMRKLTVPIVMSTIFAWILMLCYGYMTDYGDSMLRAMGMMALTLTARLVGRRCDGWTSLGLLASIMLFVRPARMLSVGFWLTYAAVAGMELGKWMLKMMRKSKVSEKESLIEKIKENVCIQTGVFVCTLPILLCSMYEIPVFGFLYNFFMIPLISFVVPMAFAACVLGVMKFSVLGAVSGLVLKYIDIILNLVHRLPSKVWVCGCPGVWQMGAFSIGILSVILLMYRKHMRLAWTVLFVSCIFLMFVRIRSDEVVFVDVGQGDGICVLTKEGHAFLVDGGSSDVSNVYTYRLEPLLKYYGVDRINGWFLSHSDQDHISGILEALDADVLIKNIFLPDCKADEDFFEIRKTAQNQGIKVQTFRPGDIVKNSRFYGIKRTDEVVFKCLYPSVFECTGDKNNDSMVLSVCIGQGDNVCRILLTGDLEVEGEKHLLRSLDKVDILKVAHHGSKGGTSETFLACIQPKWAIISCGRENRYGHPHTETLKRLSNAGCQWVTTASKGAIFVRMTSKGYKIYSYQNQD